MRFREHTRFTTVLGGVTLGVAFSVAVLPVGTTNAAYSDFALAPSTLEAGVWAPAVPAAPDAPDAPAAPDAGSPADAVHDLPADAVDDNLVVPPTAVAPESEGSATGTGGDAVVPQEPAPTAVPDASSSVITDVPGELDPQHQLTATISNGPSQTSRELPADPTATGTQP